MKRVISLTVFPCLILGLLIAVFVFGDAYTRYVLLVMLMLTALSLSLWAFLNEVTK